MLKEKIYLILGIGTDVGKTFFVESLCKNISNSHAIKPVASGALDCDLNSDPAKILSALGLEVSQKNLDQICPWRFKDPVSPHFAGDVDYEQLKQFCLDNINKAKEQKRHLFIEAAGGVMSPITNEKTFLDLACDLEIATLLVSESYLGAISHTLTAIEILKKNNIFLEKVILNEKNSSPSEIEKIAKTISAFSQSQVVKLNEFFN